MPHLSVRCSEELTAGIDAIANKYDLDKSQLVRTLLRNQVVHHEADLPEHLVSDIHHEKITAENKHKMRRLYFKNNVREKLDQLLFEKPLTPDPSVVAENYVQSLMEQIDKEHEEDEEELKQFIRAEMWRYRMLHPGSDLRRENIIDGLSALIEAEGEDEAKALVEDLADEDLLAANDDARTLLRDARTQTSSGWKEAWDKATRPYLYDDEEGEA